MSFLLDTDICSAYLKNDRQVMSKVMMHLGGLYLSAVTVAELLTWAQRAKAPPARLHGVNELVYASIVLDIDLAVAETFGSIRAQLLDRGRVIGVLDLLNAAVAIVHNLTVVTHNTADYVDIPGLTLDDWLAS